MTRSRERMAQVPLTVTTPRSMVASEVVALDAPSSGNIEGRWLFGVAMSTSRGAARSRLLVYAWLSRRAAALVSPLLVLMWSIGPLLACTLWLRIHGRGERKVS
jgi:hypothetical protein